MIFRREINHKLVCGNIEVICGSMFSGKTEELIRRLKRCLIAKKRIAVFKPEIDARYEEKKIVSHNKISIDAYVVKKTKDILLNSKDFDVIAIDEAQFFDDELLETVNVLANKGKRIIIAGLDMDYMGRPFGIMSNILAVANDVTKLRAICNNCGCLASYSFRKNNTDTLIHVGEKNDYMALCRTCFFKQNE
tara:strand:- start:1438 stop:2013 length:576 start_codon:yes stop_codon:yes gene_type:complete